jgi:hypothetical protein
MSKFDKSFETKKSLAVTSNYSSVKISVRPNIDGLSKEHFPSLQQQQQQPKEEEEPSTSTTKPSFAQILLNADIETGSKISSLDDSLFTQQKIRKEESLKFHNLVNDTISQMAVRWRKYKRDYIELYGYDTYVKMYESV